MVRKSRPRAVFGCLHWLLPVAAAVAALLLLHLLGGRGYRWGKAAASPGRERAPNRPPSPDTGGAAPAVTPAIIFAQLIFRHGARAPLWEQYAQGVLWDVCGGEEEGEGRRGVARAEPWKKMLTLRVAPDPTSAAASAVANAATSTAAAADAAASADTGGDDDGAASPAAGDLPAAAAHDGPPLPGGCFRGQLTALGRRQARRLGVWARRRYVDQEKLLPPSDDLQDSEGPHGGSAGPEHGPRVKGHSAKGRCVDQGQLLPPSADERGSKGPRGPRGGPAGL